ncbi:MAG: hypothetical protein WAT12_05535 [Candidatus Nitrotoga sp.]
MNVSKLLRDPAWQFVGAVISLLALIVTLWPTFKLTINEPTVSLCNFQQYPVFKTDPAPPDVRDRLRLTFRGKEIPVTELSVTQFCLSNHTGKTIESADFIKPLSFKATNGADVIYVRNYRQESTTSVAADWHRLDINSWEMTPTLLNLNETLWIQVVYRIPEASARKVPTEIFQWQALFKGASFKVTPPSGTDPVWYYLQIKHEGLGLYLLVGTGLIFSFVAFSIYRRRWLEGGLNTGRLIILVILAALSWAVAEIAVDSVYNQRANQPLVGWLFVIFLAGIAAASIRYIDKQSVQKNEDDFHG